MLDMYYSLAVCTLFLFSLKNMHPMTQFFKSENRITKYETNQKYKYQMFKTHLISYHIILDFGL